MKRLLTYLVFFFIGLGGSTQLQAKIWRVNNNPNIKADFTDAQSAVNGANAGDTIHLEPSSADYGAVNLNKRVVILSVGYFLSENPGNQVSTNVGRISSLSIVSTNASGSSVTTQIDGTTTITGLTNITLKRCYLKGAITITSSRDIILTGSFVQGNNDAGDHNVSLYITNSQNCIVTNNIIKGSLNMDGELSSAIIVNNVLNYGIISYYNNYIYNSQFQNNIINYRSVLVFSASTTVQNNFASSTTFPSTGNSSGNVITDMTKVFLNNKGSVDTSFQILPSSITVGAGVNGIDCGAFGGVTPYILAGQPPIPAIYKLIVPATAAGDSLHVIFSTKSNN